MLYCFDIVLMSSAFLAAEYAFASIPPARRPAAADSFLVFSAASFVFEAKASIFGLHLSYSFCRPCSFCSVSMISRCRASCAAWFLSVSPLSCICRRASFSCSSFFLVSSVALPRRSCFCRSSSMFDGSSFRRLLTSRRSFCVSRRSLLTPFRLSCSPLVWPSISIVMPLMLREAIACPLYSRSISSWVAISTYSHPSLPFSVNRS